MTQEPDRNLTQLIMHPNVGKVGKQVLVRSNFFEITSLPAQNIQHLNIQILPDSTPPAIHRKMWQSFQDSPKGQSFLNKVKSIFDDRANLFSSNPLKYGDDNLGVSFEVSQSSGRKPSEWCFQIKYQAYRCSQYE
ncbi:uncharacterized protein BX664DRAFT_103725 [Halteromyces radiatus]|uniref:uncharacterized protein n=1 Tax=Halteromyces radiatus TaxID=101107 RepID=UPI00221F049A|nr:uncharacterized protein BX664DRAFT_103725 [Halteromyces radiatus]KAI8093256.1 hypothetical protein BX664DRAFT_103725 [Halteromyces radiatus]